MEYFKQKKWLILLQQYNMAYMSWGTWDSYYENKVAIATTLIIVNDKLDEERTLK